MYVQTYWIDLASIIKTFLEVEQISQDEKNSGLLDRKKKPNMSLRL